MMHGMHMVFIFSLIALSFGGALLLLSKIHTKVGTGFIKVISYFVIIVAFLCMIYSCVMMMRCDKRGYKPMMRMQEKMQMRDNQ